MKTRSPSSVTLSSAASIMDDSSDKADNTVKINEMISQLTDHEMEIAAETSYDYFKYKNGDRKDIVRKMAQRYLDSKQKDLKVALTKMRETLAFREKVNINEIRSAFDNDNKETKSEIQVLLQHRLSKNSHYVQGYDLDGRATYIFRPRYVDEHDEEGSVKEILYTLERAIACSNSSTINILIDFSGFSLTKNTPPPSIGKKALTLLRQHYVGQINKIFIFDAPVGFSILWNMFKGFIGKETKKKLQFITHKKKAAGIMSKWYSDEKAASWMIPKRGLKNRELDVNEYLYQLSFDEAFHT